MLALFHVDFVSRVKSTFLPGCNRGLEFLRGYFGIWLTAIARVNLPSPY